MIMSKCFAPMYIISKEHGINQDYISKLEPYVDRVGVEYTSNNTLLVEFVAKCKDQFIEYSIGADVSLQIHKKYLVRRYDGFRLCKIPGDYDIFFCILSDGNIVVHRKYADECIEKIKKVTYKTVLESAIYTRPKDAFTAIEKHCPPEVLLLIEAELEM